MRGGTHSLKKHLEKQDKEVILLDQWLYMKDIEKYLLSYYGDVPIYFIKRKNKKEHSKSLKRVFHRIRLRRLSNFDIKNMLNYEKHINRFKDVFSEVIVIDLEDSKFGYHELKTKKLHHLIGYYLPTEILLLYKEIKDFLNRR